VRLGQLGQPVLIQLCLDQLDLKDQQVQIRLFLGLQVQLDPKGQPVLTRLFLDLKVIRVTSEILGQQGQTQQYQDQLDHKDLPVLIQLCLVQKGTKGIPEIQVPPDRLAPQG
jgi:hypothetical protein